MKPVSMILSLSLTLLLASDGFAASRKEAGVMTPMKYEGGSLPLGLHDGLNTYVNKDEVVLVQGKKRFVIPVKDITEVSYGNDVHRRVGAAVGVALVSFGVGALLLLVKTKKHYVGVVWADKNAPATANAAVTNAAVADTSKAAKANVDTAKGGVVFKVGKGEYRGFMTALEGVAGIKAVNADAVGSGGTSKQ